MELENWIDEWNKFFRSAQFKSYSFISLADEVNIK